MKKYFYLMAIIGIIGVIIGCSEDVIKTRIVDNVINEDRLKEIKEKGIITIAPALNDIPFFYIDNKTNKVVGIDADIINEIAKRLGINKVDMKETSFSNLLDRLNTSNDIDLAAGGIYITPEREKYVSFTQPLYKETETVVVPRDSKINFKDDLKNAVVGVEKGTVFADLARKWKENNLVKDVVLFNSISELLEAINSGKVDAGIADSITINFILPQKKNFFLRALKGYTPELPGVIGIAVKKNDTTLLNALNEKIMDMKADGTLYAILVANGLNKSNMI